MQKINGWDEVKASGEFERLPNGAYQCTIITAEDIADKQYLKINFDICDGVYLQFASQAYSNLGFWILSTVRSYKGGCEGMFKQFTNAVEASNDGYKWDWNENSLEGCDFGAVIVTEQYLKDNGDEGLRYKVKNVFGLNDFDKYAAKTYEDAYSDDLKKPKTEATATKAENPFKK